MFSCGAEMSTFRFPGILFVLRLNTAEDFFISVRALSKSSSLSLSFSYGRQINYYRGSPQMTSLGNYLSEEDIDG